MNNEDKYDELENIIDTLNSLTKEINDEYYIDLIEAIILEAEDEKYEIEVLELQEKSKAEHRQMNSDFERSRL